MCAYTVQAPQAEGQSFAWGCFISGLLVGGACDTVALATLNLFSGQASSWKLINLLARTGRTFARWRAFLAQSSPDAFEQATVWYAHPAWEVRSFALALLGGLAGHHPPALAFLFEHCGDDAAWQANEALAMAFDDYCAAVGYEQALPTIRQWLLAPQANLRRAGDRSAWYAQG
jgi:hypothetical protein